MMPFKDKILACYATSSYLLRNKARFIFYLCLTELLLIPVMLIYTIYLQEHDPLTGFSVRMAVLFPILVLFFVNIIVLFLLARGLFSHAAHLLLIISLAAGWTVIFLDRANAVSRLDTIALVLAIFTILPLIVLKRKSVIFLYAAGNIATLFIFMFINESALNISRNSFWDYISDNTISIIFISICAYYIFSINQQAIERTELEIAERKHAEDELRDSKTQLDLAVQSAKLGMWSWDIINKKRYFDNQVCHLLGIDPATFTGTEEEFFKVVHPDDVETIKAALSRTIEQNVMYKVEYPIIWPDKSVHYISARGMVVHDQVGRPERIHGMVWDVTERKHEEEERRNLEERLQRAEKMEALGTLAGGVAHDLNNVLGVIVGYSELLLNEVDKSNSIRPRLEKIMGGSEKAAAIVQDLLTLARRGVSGRKAINLNKIILDYQNSPEWEKLSSYHPAVRINFNLEPNLLNISGSSVHLSKTLFNLVSNAAEAMPKGGDLTIKTTNQYLDKPIHGYDHINEGDYVVLSVTDTGEGIPAGDIQRIFEPFYTKKVMGRSGTGLGLAVIWGTVKDHQGYINVQSEEGKGSTFTLYFPITREEISAEAASISVSEYMGKEESVLVVDDVKEQRELAADMLKKLNYQVATVTSGEEAIAYLKEHKVGILVLDMIMDLGMDGLDTYKGILEINPKQKAIIVSGFSESDRVKEAQKLGAGAYVKKPYIMENIGMSVRKELDKK